MSVCPLPPNANLEHLKKQAKVVQRAVRAGDEWGLGLVAEFHPRLAPLVDDPARLADFSRADAQFVIARQYGLASWNVLRRHLGIVSELARSPHEQPVDGKGSDVQGAGDEVDRADLFLRLACLKLGQDHPDRRQRAMELFTRDPQVVTANIYAAAAVGDVGAVTAMLADDPALARTDGGPFRYPPLMYLTYARIEGWPESDPLACARALLAADADPNAGYLWEGLVPPFTALTGVFGEGEGGPVNQPRHPLCVPLGRLLLQAGLPRCWNAPSTSATRQKWHSSYRTGSTPRGGRVPAGTLPLTRRAQQRGCRRCRNLGQRAKRVVERPPRDRADPG
ncbi:MAG: hypothetical protein ACR2HR_04875 [Euzebya sp.]